MLKASICTIGDEILIGQIVDTNKSYISSALNSTGVKVIYHHSIGDDEETIEEVINNSLKTSDIVIVTGGLGPTKDDITKKVLAKISGSKLMIYDNTQLEIIEGICKKRGIELSLLNRDQSLVPENCTVLPNRHGTAPGMMFRIGEKLLFSLPGVPYEMQYLMDEVINIVSLLKNCETIIHRSVNTYGIPESELAVKISDWEDNLPSGFKLAYLPNPAKGVKLRLSIYNGEERDNLNGLNLQLKQLKELLGISLYGEEEDTLESVVSKALSERKETLSLAESCTGGNISRIFVSIPGSSSILKGGVVAYDNSAKTDILGVDKSIIEEYGAVSKECVIAMVNGAKRLFDSDWSIATSGIAGPEGGAPGKPVGTIWVAVSGPDILITQKYLFSGDRERNIIRFSSSAIDLLRRTMRVELNI